VLPKYFHSLALSLATFQAQSPSKACYRHISRVVGLSDDSALVCDKLPTGVSVERERPMSDDNTKDRHWETTRVQRADVGETLR
jgi:hypothetical protein